MPGRKGLEIKMEEGGMKERMERGTEEEEEGKRRGEEEKEGEGG